MNDWKYEPVERPDFGYFEFPLFEKAKIKPPCKVTNQVKVSQTLDYKTGGLKFLPQ